MASVSRTDSLPASRKAALVGTDRIETCGDDEQSGQRSYFARLYPAGQGQIRSCHGPPRRLRSNTARRRVQPYPFALTQSVLQCGGRLTQPERICLCDCLPANPTTIPTIRKQSPLTINLKRLGFRRKMKPNRTPGRITILKKKTLDSDPIPDEPQIGPAIFQAPKDKIASSGSPSAPEFLQPPKYLGVSPSPTKRPGDTSAGRRLELERATASREGGDSNGSCLAGGGDYR